MYTKRASTVPLKNKRPQSEPACALSQGSPYHTQPLCSTFKNFWGDWVTLLLTVLTAIKTHTHTKQIIMDMVFFSQKKKKESKILSKTKRWKFNKSKTKHSDCVSYLLMHITWVMVRYHGINNIRKEKSVQKDYYCWKKFLTFFWSHFHSLSLIRRYNFHFCLRKLSPHSVFIVSV